MSNTEDICPFCRTNHGYVSEDATTLQLINSYGKALLDCQNCGKEYLLEP